MKNTILFLLVLVVLLLSYNTYMGFKRQKEKPTIVNYDYKTDFEKLDKTFEDKLDELRRELISYKNAPPKIIREYTIEKPTYIIEKYYDSIIRITDTVTKSYYDVDSKFLTLYPNNSKLITFELKKDLLNLSTLNIEGQVLESSWPMDFNNYEYIYLNGNLSYNQIKNQSLRRKFDFTNIYLNAGYNFIGADVETSLIYQLDLSKRIRTTFEGRVNINNLDDNRALIKLGYRLFPKN